LISEEKMTHVIHLMLESLKKSGLADYAVDGTAIREAKLIAFGYLKQLDHASEKARQRILSQKNPPVEYSSQWDILYKKYYEEEWNKLGGGSQ